MPDGFHTKTPRCDHDGKRFGALSVQADFGLTARRSRKRCLLPFHSSWGRSVRQNRSNPMELPSPLEAYNCPWKQACSQLWRTIKAISGAGEHYDRPQVRLTFGS